MPDDAVDRIAVVIITWNRSGELLRTLRFLSDLPERPPIVVVNNGSKESVAQVQRDFPRVRVIHAGANLGAKARNLGVEATSTDYVAFCDDDAWWQAGSLRRAVEILDSHKQTALVMGQVIIEPEGRADPICHEITAGPLPRQLDYPGYPLVGFLAGASVVRRIAFLEAGGFRADLGIGGEEDWLAAELLELGWQLCYSPELCLHHFPSPCRDHRQRRRQVLRNDLCFAWLRRPAGSALRRTWRLARLYDLDVLRNFAAAAVRIAVLWRMRRAVPAELDRSYCLLEEWQRRARSSRAGLSNEKRCDLPTTT